ncbi:Uncharacterised protein [Mycobacterium tuberculosis]|uniref:Uncharacterized protein n=1 Tax=Mycobacterium tuberculosis TaxID=1773 RepID=A0A0U0R3C2_MYCTX|nr:Uncharacterised protein [Mycobacterium tuberculosis]COV71607.1 Uncharacterised protein [Mycobacterium tuberculosis]SGO47254.1 Uncharacterised protein [Mycobacterium tuberculosis]
MGCSGGRSPTGGGPPAASCALSPEEPLGAVMVINLSRQRCSPFGGPRSLAG